VIAGEAMDQSAALLTDPNKITFTYAMQLPYLKIAWRELQEALVLNGVADVDEKFTIPQTITAGTKEWTAQPVDLLIPIAMWENDVGGIVQNFDAMIEREAEPTEPMGPTLDVWWFAEAIIKFRGATTNRDVILKYQRELTAIASENTLIPIPGSMSFLAFRTAGIIARARGQRTRADDLDRDASLHQSQLLSTKVNNEQINPVRPKRYGFGRRRSTRVMGGF
jgi:hypothetical protein